MAKSRRLNDLLDRLAEAEDRFLTGEFLAPRLRRQPVQVRIAGVVCQLNVEPDDFHGWGVFQPLSHTLARLARPAGLAERQRYLELFPLVRLILCARQRDCWPAMPAQQADGRFRIEGPVAVHFVEEGQLFEVVESRFDGNFFWFDRLDARRDPATAVHLREAFAHRTPPEQVSRPGLSAEERAVFTMLHEAREHAEEEARRDHNEKRLRAALDHAGAEFTGYVELPDSYRVEYLVDGQRHLSVVQKGDLTVQSAGICLSGEDERFDLQSLVGVLRQGQSEEEPNL